MSISHEYLFDLIIVVFYLLLFCPCFAQLFGHLMPLEGFHLSLPRHLLQVISNHPCPDAEVLLFRLMSLLHNLKFLLIQSLPDEIVCDFCLC